MKGSWKGLVGEDDEFQMEADCGQLFVGLFPVCFMWRPPHPTGRAVTEPKAQAGSGGALPTHPETLMRHCRPRALRTGLCRAQHRGKAQHL